MSFEEPSLSGQLIHKRRIHALVTIGSQLRTQIIDRNEKYVRTINAPKRVRYRNA